MDGVVTALNDVSVEDISRYGMKAQNLWKMYEKGVRIPQTLLIACPQSWLHEEKEENILHQAEEEVRRIFADCKGIMVRSSFEFEDLERSSRAGKFKSIFVRDKNKTVEAIKEVWEYARLAVPAAVSADDDRKKAEAGISGKHTSWNVGFTGRISASVYTAGEDNGSLRSAE